MMLVPLKLPCTTVNPCVHDACGDGCRERVQVICERFGSREFNQKKDNIVYTDFRKRVSIV